MFPFQSGCLEVILFANVSLDAALQIMLNRSGKRGHLYLRLDLRGSTFNLLTANTVLPMCFHRCSVLG